MTWVTSSAKSRSSPYVNMDWQLATVDGQFLEIKAEPCYNQDSIISPLIFLVCRLWFKMGTQLESRASGSKPTGTIKQVSLPQGNQSSFTANFQNKCVVFYNDILTEGFVIQDSQLRESKPRCTLVLATNRTLNRFWL